MNFKKFLIILFLIFTGSYITFGYKENAKTLQNSIDQILKNILVLEQEIKKEKVENNFLKNPNRIQNLASEYLKKDYQPYKKKDLMEYEIHEK